MVDKELVRQRVRASWVQTAIAFGGLAASMGLIVLTMSHFGVAEAIKPVMLYGLLFGVGFFLASEPINKIRFKAVRAMVNRHPHLISSMEELCREQGISRLPRLYIIKLKDDEPGAFTFGMGLFGQTGIGVSQELYDLLTPDELKAVLAHELAHARSFDTGLISAVMILTGGVDRFAWLFLRGRSVLGRNPLTYVIGVTMALVSRLAFPMGRARLMRQREIAADALGALYIGSSRPVMSALVKLRDALKKIRMEKGSNMPRPEEILGGWLATHPPFETRLRLLRELDTEETL